MSPSETSDDTHLSFESVHMAFGDRQVFKGLCFSFPRGRISIILGGSGSGKTTALRLVGGLVHPVAGRIHVAGEEITALSERQMYRVRRKLGMLFQGGALLDSLTIFDNLAFPLREHTTMSEGEIAAEVRDRLRAVDLSDVDDLLPNQLSGGMTKRVALARAIVGKPLILLCDEPLSGLDPISARRIEALLMDINRELDITMLIVSHDVPSTMRMASRVLLLLPDGAIEGTPAEVQRSGDARVAAFLAAEGNVSYLPSAEVERVPIEPRGGTP